MTTGSGRVRMSALVSASVSLRKELHWHTIMRRRCSSLLVENEPATARFAQGINGPIVVNEDFTR
jgi:hypothetical protein